MVAPIQQSTLNRLKASVVFATLPQLGVTSPFLGKQGLSLTFEGDAGQLLPTMTGGVTSPEPYQFATVEMHLLKTQGLANAYKDQIESDVNVGTINVIGDAATMEEWQLQNCIIQSEAPGAFDGQNPEFVVRIRGVYYINRALWTAA
jgi:hypothetical protein